MGAALVPVFLAVGCSPSVPSARQVEQMLDDQVVLESHASIKLVHFEKVNGQKSEIAGIELYEMEYKCEIKFFEDCWWTDKDAFGYWTGHFFVGHGDPASVHDQIYNPTFSGDKKHRDDHMTLTGKLKFEKTEKGWRAQNGELLGTTDNKVDEVKELTPLREKYLQGAAKAELDLGKMYLGGIREAKNTDEGERVIDAAATQHLPEAKIEVLLLQSKKPEAYAAQCAIL
jgi:hypothetical protein